MVFSSLLSHRRDAAFAHIPGSIRHRRAPHRDRGLRASLLDCSTTDYPTDFENKEYGAEKWRTSLSLFAAGMSSFIVGIFQHQRAGLALPRSFLKLPRIAGPRPPQLQNEAPGVSIEIETGVLRGTRG
jgi:hypothetical protein